MIPETAELSTNRSWHFTDPNSNPNDDLDELLDIGEEDWLQPDYEPAKLAGAKRKVSEVGENFSQPDGKKPNIVSGSH